MMGTDGNVGLRVPHELLDDVCNIQFEQLVRMKLGPWWEVLFVSKFPLFYCLISF